MEHHITFIRTRTQDYEISITLTPSQYEQVQKELISEGIYDQHKYYQDAVGQAIVKLGFYTPSEKDELMTDPEDTYEGMELENIIIPCEDFHTTEKPDLYYFETIGGKFHYQPFYRVWNYEREGYFTNTMVIPDLVDLGYNYDYYTSDTAEEYIKTLKEQTILTSLYNKGEIKTREYNKKYNAIEDLLIELKYTLVVETE